MTRRFIGAEEPVLRYTDNTRKLYDSTIWIWGATGRPSAAMAIEFYPPPRARAAMAIWGSRRCRAVELLSSGEKT
jgi:hypothetical protein